MGMFLYKSYVDIIKDIRFTKREIEIISCIINGRTSKSIADLLKISPNTVNVNIRNLFHKIGCNSQEQIISFVEDSSCYSEIHNLYFHISSRRRFEKLLLKIAPHVRSLVCNIYRSDFTNFSQEFLSDLQLSGFKTFVFNFRCAPKLKQDAISIICSNSVHDISSVHEKVYFFAESFDDNFAFNKIEYNQANYFISFLKFLEDVCDNLKAREISREFKSHSFLGKNNDVHSIESNIKNRNRKYIYSILFVLSVVVVFFTMFYGTNRHTTSNITIVANNLILKRPLVIEKIKQVFLSNLKISVIVGEGGAGKTTIARKYILNSEFDIAWEINAESESTIYSSMLKLANAISKSESQINEITFIRNIQNQDEKKSKLLVFISEALKNKKWILLFDNVNNFNLVKTYLPYGADIWNHGKLLITTRNTNIANISLFSNDNIIEIGSLSDKEKAFLFNKISGCRLLSDSENKLLLKIPSLPLDICSAAYYIKATKTSFDNYLSMLQSNDKNFDATQSKLLDENLTYDKTRYKIITSCIKSVISSNPEYKKLMWMLSLLHSQDICKKYLYKICDKILVDNFIHELRKHSLITEDNDSVSIHRFTQQITLTYLSDAFTKEEKKTFSDFIVGNMTKCNEIAWFLYEHDREPDAFHDHFTDLHRHLSIMREKLKFITESDKERNMYYIKISLAILHSAKYIESEERIRNMAHEILNLNDKYRALSNLDLAVLLEIYGSKSINNNTERAYKILSECLRLCDNASGTECIKAICLADFAKLLGILGNIELALKYFEQAMAIIIDSDKFWKIQTKVTIFNRYQNCLSSYYVSSEKLLSVIDLGHKILQELNSDRLFHRTEKGYCGNHAMSILMIRRNMTAIYNRIGNTEKALENVKEALFFLNLIKCKKDEYLKYDSKLLIDYGCVLLRQNKINEAIDFLTKGIDVGEKINRDNGLMILAYLFRAEALIRINKLDEAWSNCLLVLNISDKLIQSNSAKISKALCLYNMALIRHKQNDDTEALKIFRELFEIMNDACRLTITDEKYKNLEKNSYFKYENDIKACLKKSYEIFSIIYSKKHPFVKNYVSKQCNI